MPLKLETCSDADMDRAFAIVSAAFGREHPYQNTIFPDHDTEPGRKIGAERMLATKKSDPNTTFIKVVDTETDKMIALGKWNVFNGTVPEEIELEGDFGKIKMTRSTRSIYSEVTSRHAERLSRIQEESWSVSRLCTPSIITLRTGYGSNSDLMRGLSMSPRVLESIIIMLLIFQRKGWGRGIHKSSIGWSDQLRAAIEKRD